jgi:RecA/RadA recombinase
MPTRTAQEALKSLNLLDVAGIHVGADPDLAVTFVQTGLLPFDVIMGGGLARGRIALMFGQSQTFKSYLMMHTAKVALAQAEAAGRSPAVAVIVDTERAFDPKWATKIGVPLDQLIILREQTGEDMVDTVTAILQKAAPDENGKRELNVEFVGWDSLAATLTQEMAGKTATETDRVGTTARFAHRMFRRLGPEIDKAQCAFLVLNQVYSQITGYGGVAQAGGKAVDFYPTQRFKVTRIQSDTEKEEAWQYGQRKTLSVGHSEAFLVEVDKDRTQYRPKPVGFKWLVRESRIDVMDFALNHGLNLEVVSNVRDSEFRWKAEDGTVYEAKQYWRMRKKLEEAPAEHQQQLMDQVLRASNPELVTS